MAGSNTAEKNKPQSADIVDISKGAQGAGGKKARSKRRAASRLKLLIFLLVFLLAVGCAGYVIFNNDFFGVRTAFFELIHSIDPDYREVSDREAELDEREERLSELSAKLDEQQERQSSVENQLKAQEQYLKTLERSNTPVYRPPVNEDDVVYMKNIGKIYAAMDPARAADIMVRLLSAEDMAAVIYYMPQANAAAVLELMDHDVAAEITDRLLHE